MNTLPPLQTSFLLREQFHPLDSEVHHSQQLCKWKAAIMKSTEVQTLGTGVFRQRREKLEMLQMPRMVPGKFADAARHNVTSRAQNPLAIAILIISMHGIIIGF